MDELARLQNMGAQPILKLQKKTLKELEELLVSPLCEADTRQREIVLNLITHKRLEAIGKPHWTRTPSFWIAVVGSVAACIAAAPVVRDWLQPQEQKRGAVVQQIPPAKDAQTTSPQQSPVSPPAPLSKAKK